MTLASMRIGLVVLGLALAILMVVGAILTRSDVWSWPAATHAGVSEGLPQASEEVWALHLTAGRAQWELAPGRMVHAYAYNSHMPGPELRVTEGDTVRVTVRNDLQEPTTNHWHGVEVPVAMDGVPVLSQEPIAPAATFTY